MRQSVNSLVSRARLVRDQFALAPAAKDEARRDRQSTHDVDPGLAPAVAAALDWLGVAQDESTSHDGGIARHFSLTAGWGASYPETSGYIVPTLLRAAPGQPARESRERARRVLDWLVAIQLPDGAFAGGMIGQTPVVPVTFNTGQILIGLASGVVEFGDEYRAAMRRAADWLVRTQHPDGAWRDHPTPFAGAGEKSYETHVAWGLLEAARIDPDRGYGDAALRNIRWALTKQGDSGWFADCCLTDPARPLAHTIGYVLRGILEGYRYSGDAALLDAALKTANGLLSALSTTGMLPGRLTSTWSPAAKWSCLTGSVQIAHCWLMLFQFTGDQKFLEAARRTNAYVRARVRVDGPREIRGAVKGSYPVDGEYGQFEYLNWACKFFIDSNILEEEIVASLNGVVV